MKARRYIRSLAAAALLVTFAAGNAGLTHAASSHDAPTPATPAGLGATGVGGESDPVVLPATQAQLQDHARRLDEGKAARNAGVQPNSNFGNYGGTSATANVTAYTEPNLSQYWNYCGVVSSQTVISHWTGNVPGIDSMGQQESVNVYQPGIRLQDAVGPINNDGGTGGFYVNQVAGSQTTFNNWVGSDVRGHGAPLMTALRTSGNGWTLNGWGSNTGLAHIVAVYGYNFTSGSGTIYYVESSSSSAGNSATGRNSYNDDGFWSLITLNNGQIW